MGAESSQKNAKAHNRSRHDENPHRACKCWGPKIIHCAGVGNICPFNLHDIFVAGWFDFAFFNCGLCGTLLGRHENMHAKCI